MEQVLGRIIMDFSGRFGINLSAIAPILTDSRLPMSICSPGQDQTTRAPSFMLTFKHARPFSCTFQSAGGAGPLSMDHLEGGMFYEQ